MAQPSSHLHPTPPAPNAYSSPVSIIGPQFCAPYPLDLAIVRKAPALSDGNFAVTDINCNILFKVKGKLLSLHDKRVLLDGAGNPLLISLHEKWHVFRGDSTDFKDLLFTAAGVKKLVLFVLERLPQLLAPMQKMLSVGGILVGKDKFMVTVYPNVDYAFIVALIVILDAINSDDD
ncbi:hypothetical protein Pint_35000 [Pistacia integerrima]|uniref:Uncharacterized protein n=1 Tax=Pistacia integerrima TaxID=434235 RepID=A0ACC0XZF0_9ROSI|nr:hypothetical protein Pint_35000 [Pistacia integerrima]